MITIDGGTGTILHNGVKFNKESDKMVQQWQTTSHQTLSTSYVTLNTWQAVALTGAGALGTGLTHDSGTFSFPSTGIYRLEATGTFNDQSNSQDFMNIGLI